MLPTIGDAFNIPVNRQQWISSSYSIALGSSLLFFGRIADMYPKRLVFICGCIGMVVVGIVIPFSPNEIAFNVLRALQGLCASTMIPSAVGILGLTFVEQRKRQYAFAIYAAGSALGAVTGNVLAGVIDAYLSWKWVFWVIALTGAVDTLVAFFIIPGPIAPIKKLGIDWIKFDNYLILRLAACRSSSG
ncbi:MFS general substrate transporter [Penicillium angulare]|uniref:MFS general substrate transporter n=1 Tax=Penicillium angulare TaxID=116970 RepID=A0A9W9FV43_9EURO|nr:MFS general substrate transporter [Penicillium angulare]